MICICNSGKLIKIQTGQRCFFFVPCCKHDLKTNKEVNRFSVPCVVFCVRIIILLVWTPQKKKAPPPKNISSLFKIQIKSASAAVWCARSAGLELLIAELFEEKVKNLVHRVQFQHADRTQVLIYYSWCYDHKICSMMLWYIWMHFGEMRTSPAAPVGSFTTKRQN